MKNIWSLHSALFFVISAFCLRLYLLQRSRRGGACDPIPLFPGQHLVCNGIDRGKAAESLKN